MSFQLIELDTLLKELQQQNDLDEMLSKVIRNIEIECTFQSLGIFLKDGEKGQYRIRLGRHLSHTYLENKIIEEDHPLLEKIFENDYLEFNDPQQFQFEKTYSHLAILPLFFQNEKLGFYFLDKKNGQFTSRDFANLEIFGSLLSIMVQVLTQKHVIENLYEYDRLTGLYNYRGFIRHGEYLFNQSRRYSRHLTLAVLKMHDFSQMERSEGSQKAKALLIFIAERLKLNLRTTEIMGLVYPDTFAILLPETNKQNSLIAIIRLNEAIEKLKAISNINLSWGIVSLNPKIKTLEEFLQVAEKTGFEAAKNTASNILIYEE